MEEKDVKLFVLEYMKGVDLIDCTNYAIQSNFQKPEDYDNYGCKIAFLSEKDTSVKNENDLKTWYIAHNNQYLSIKMNENDSLHYSFPPMFNFPSDEDLTLVQDQDNRIIVEVSGDNGNYRFTISVSSEAELGYIIDAIRFKMRWGNDWASVIG